MDDLYRTIRIDSGSGELFFNDLDTIFSFTPGGSDSQVVLQRSDGVGTPFWLEPNLFLLPGGSNGVLVSMMPAVLYSAPRGGGELR